MSEPQFSLDAIFKIVEIVSILGGGGFVAFRLGRTTTRFEEAIKVQNVILEQQRAEVSELKRETQKIGDVLTSIAVQETRLERIEKNYEELRRGEGFVFPFQVDRLAATHHK